MLRPPRLARGVRAAAEGREVTRPALKVYFVLDGKLEHSYFLADAGYKFVFDGAGRLSVQDRLGQLYYRNNVRSVESVEVKVQ